MEASERHMEKVFLNGDIYVGDFKGMLPHGTGKYTWSDGSIYEGEWEEGKMTGKGHFQWASGAAYEGDFSGGFLHGFGTFTGLDGSVYTGAWRMNVQNGVGNKKYCNSDIYEGSWKEGVRNGCGRYTWNAQNTYVGNWKDGKMCGRGVMNWENGDLFDGFWLDGLRHGSGFYRFADGGYYFGTWTRGQKDGPGTFYPAGSKLPSLTRWRSTAGYYDKIQTMLPHTSPVNLGELRDHKLGMKHSLSEKLSFGLVRGSGRISHRTISLDGAPSADDPLAEVPARDSFSTDEDQTVEQGSCNLVYEREYMQGVLISERVRNNEAEMTQKNKCELKGTKKSGETIFKGHRSYYLMLNLQLGIRYTVGKITPVPRREVRSSDFGPRARIRMYFPRKGSQLTPPHYSIGFYWKDYCPMVFRNLREMFKIDAADYMMSICGCDSLRELSSPGKSGSIFYLSQDERFFIKTLKESELKVLLKMLPKYYEHVKRHDNTLITKFFGLHHITLRGGREVRFVVMGNMFCTGLRIHRRYDLKGSSHGRSTNEHDIDENTTLKDLDLKYEFYLDKSLRDSLFKQISLDCTFLESQCIIDYSLLLGLHFRAPEHLKAPLGSADVLDHESSLAGDGTSSHGELLIPSKGLLLVTHEPGVSIPPGPHSRGNPLRVSSAGNKEVDLFLPGTGRLTVQLGVHMPAQANRKLPHAEADSTEAELFEVYDVVLYLGIIDILQEYNMKKKIEHACKSLLHSDPLSISVIEPKQYHERLINFLEEKVFPHKT